HSDIRTFGRSSGPSTPFIYVRDRHRCLFLPFKTGEILLVDFQLHSRSHHRAKQLLLSDRVDFDFMFVNLGYECLCDAAVLFVMTLWQKFDSSNGRKAFVESVYSYFQTDCCTPYALRQWLVRENIVRYNAAQKPVGHDHNKHMLLQHIPLPVTIFVNKEETA
ncbi:MAG: hypothetical protein ACRC0J_11320, partial [Shewanella oncorhynchi]